MKPNEIEIKFIANGLNQADQILVFLRRTIYIALFVNEPRDPRIRAELRAQLLGEQPRATNKIRPPMIMRINLVLLPLIHGGSAYDDDVFPLLCSESVAADQEQGHK